MPLDENVGTNYFCVILSDAVIRLEPTYFFRFQLSAKSKKNRQVPELIYIYVYIYICIYIQYIVQYIYSIYSIFTIYIYIYLYIVYIVNIYIYMRILLITYNLRSRQISSSLFSLVNILAKNPYFFPTHLQILEPLFPFFFPVFFPKNLLLSSSTSSFSFKYLLSIKFQGPWHDVFPPKYLVGDDFLTKSWKKGS